MYYAQLTIINKRAVVTAVTETATALPAGAQFVPIQSLDASLLGKTYQDGVFV